MSMTLDRWEPTRVLAKIVEHQRWDEAIACFEGAYPEAKNDVRFSLLMSQAVVSYEISAFDDAIRYMNMAAALQNDLSGDYRTPATTYSIAQALHVYGDSDSAQALIAAVAAESCPPGYEIFRRRLARAVAIRRRVGGIRRPRHIVSLGQNCMVGNLSRRWGLGNLLEDGPFSAALTGGNGVSLALESDFVEFSAQASYRMVKTANGSGMPMIPKYVFAMNHELGGYWGDNGFRRLIDLYGARVQTFRRQIEAPSLLICVRENPIDGRRLQEALAAHGDDYRLLIIDIMPQGAPNISVFDDMKTRIVRLPVPVEGYTWYTDYDTGPGFVFEGHIAQIIADEVAWDHE